jgi:hypothetical protein
MPAMPIEPYDVGEIGEPAIVEGVPGLAGRKTRRQGRRKGGILQVHAIHEDVPFSPATKSAVHSEVEELAAWLGLEITGL